MTCPALGIGPWLIAHCLAQRGARSLRPARRSSISTSSRTRNRGSTAANGSVQRWWSCRSVPWCTSWCRCSRCLSDASAAAPAPPGPDHPGPFLDRGRLERGRWCPGAPQALAERRFRVGLGVPARVRPGRRADRVQPSADIVGGADPRRRVACPDLTRFRGLPTAVQARPPAIQPASSEAVPTSADRSGLRRMRLRLRLLKIAKAPQDMASPRP